MRHGIRLWPVAETLAYLKAFTPKFIEEGDVYVNVTWVSEAEFGNLKA